VIRAASMISPVCGSILIACGGRWERHSTGTHLISVVLQAASGQREAIAVYGSDYPNARWLVETCDPENILKVKQPVSGCFTG